MIEFITDQAKYRITNCQRLVQFEMLRLDKYPRGIKYKSTYKQTLHCCFSISVDPLLLGLPEVPVAAVAAVPLPLPGPNLVPVVVVSPGARLHVRHVDALGPGRGAGGAPDLGRGPVLQLQRVHVQGRLFFLWVLFLEVLVLAERLEELIEQVHLHVLGHLPQEEPVAVGPAPAHLGHVLPSVEGSPENEGSDLRKTDTDEAIDDGEGGGDRQDDQPDPDNKVDLLIDDVQGQEAESIVILDAAAHAVLVELALGHLGEHLVHRVPGNLILLVVFEDAAAVVEELAVKEYVRQVDLEEDDEEVFPK